MRREENCDLCTATLDLACKRYGQEFCDLKERYFTDPEMGVDDVLMEITVRMTPEQRVEVANGLIDLGLATLKPGVKVGGV